MIKEDSLFLMEGPKTHHLKKIRRIVFKTIVDIEWVIRDMIVCLNIVKNQSLHVTNVEVIKMGE